MSISEAQRAMREGRLPEARRLLESVVQSKPGNPEVHYNLAMVLVRLAAYAEAAEQFRHCLRHAPGHVDLLNNLGNALRLSGQHPAAREVLDEALGLAPGHAALRCNRGWVRLAMDEPAAAAADFQAVLDQRDDIEDAWQGLLQALIAGAKWREAVAVGRRATKRLPDSASLWNTLGAAHSKQLEFEQAMECFRRAVKLDAGNAEALVNLGITAEQVGELDLAEHSLLRALERSPQHPGARFHLANLAGHKPSAEEVTAIEQAIASTAAEDALVELHFAAGKTLAKLNEHHRAFRHFLAAREGRARLEYFDLTAALAALEPRATRLTSQPTAGPQRRIFVIGMPRSGTTLVDQILASHPRVHSLGEARIGAQLESRLRSRTSAADAWALEGQDCADLAQWLRRQLPVPEACNAAVDTSPGHFTMLGVIAELLPEAVFVHVSRDPLDNCVSLFETPLTGNHGYANTLEDLGRYYAAYRRTMAHWLARYPGRIHNLAYESLVSSPREAISALLAHCQLPFDEACLRFHERQRSVATPSASQVRRPVNTRSIGRWRHYEAFLSPLRRALEDSQHRAMD